MFPRLLIYFPTAAPNHCHRLQLLLLYLRFTCLLFPRAVTTIIHIGIIFPVYTTRNLSCVLVVNCCSGLFLRSHCQLLVNVDIRNFVINYSNSQRCDLPPPRGDLPINGNHTWLGCNVFKPIPSYIENCVSFKYALTVARNGTAPVMLRICVCYHMSISI